MSSERKGEPVSDFRLNELVQLWTSRFTTSGPGSEALYHDTILALAELQTRRELSGRVTT